MTAVILTYLAVGIAILSVIWGLFKALSTTDNSTKEKGDQGEKNILGVLKYIEGEHYILKNLYIPHGDNTTEIDIVLLHEKGIFVIESKNYSGWIIGENYDQYWYEIFPSGKKYKFYNPIYQNYKHINALIDLLKFKSEEHIWSYVVFGNKCDITETPTVAPRTLIIQANELLVSLQNDFNELETIFSSQTLTALYTILSQYENPDEAVKAKHREQFTTN